MKFYTKDGKNNNKDNKLIFPQNNSLTEEQRNEFISNDMIKYNYYDMIKMALKKYGYSITDDIKLSYEKNSNYNQWKENKIIKYLKMIKESIEYTFNDKKYINLLNELIEDRIY